LQILIEPEDCFTKQSVSFSFEAIYESGSASELPQAEIIMEAFSGDTSGDNNVADSGSG